MALLMQANGKSTTLPVASPPHLSPRKLQLPLAEVAEMLPSFYGELDVHSTPPRVHNSRSAPIVST